MMRILVPLLAALSLAACTAQTGSLEPIPGSITYGGQPRTKLTKAPVGSTLSHTFYDTMGRQVDETYIIQPDRSLRLIRRHVRLDYY